MLLGLAVRELKRRLWPLLVVGSIVAVSVFSLLPLSANAYDNDWDHHCGYHNWQNHYWRYRPGLRYGYGGYGPYGFGGSYELYGYRGAYGPYGGGMAMPLMNNLNRFMYYRHYGHW